MTIPVKLITVQLEVEEEYADHIEASLRRAISDIEFEHGVELGDTMTINVSDK
jgi:hypothetical protein